MTHTRNATRSRARLTICVFFALQGIIVGTWASRIPDIKNTLGLDDAALGIALLAGPLGTMLGLPLARLLVDTVGSAWVTRVAGTAYCLSLFGIAAAREIHMLAVSLLVFGLIAVIFDVATNTAGLHVERSYQRSLMASFHATYNIGAVLGASLGGLCAVLGLGLAWTFAVAALPAATIAIGAGRGLRPPYLTIPPPIRKNDENPQGSSKPSARHTLRIWLLGMLAFGGYFADGIAEHWSAVYLHDSTGAAPGTAALGFAAYSVAMILGRLLGDRLADAYGASRLVRVGALLGALSLAAGLIVGNSAGGILGFALMGLGFSSIVPQALASAGHLDPSRSASSIARVSGVGFLGLLAGPPIVGLIADRLDLAIALCLPVILGLLVAAGAGLVRSNKFPSSLDTYDRLGTRI